MSGKSRNGVSLSETVKQGETYMMPQAQFQVKEAEVTALYGKFEIEPLEAGYGHTLGNALRRVLLTSIAGYSITEVKIEGITHQFTTLEGMSEDIVDVILNLKQVRITSTLQHGATCKLVVKGKDTSEVTAGMIECEAGFEVVNKDLHIATLDPKSKLNIEMTVNYGIGYSMATERKGYATGVIPVDALYSPVTKVAYTIHSTRVGRRTDFDKIIMEIWTNGSVSPKQTLIQAAEILAAQFQQIVNPTAVLDQKRDLQLSPEKAEVLRLTVEELDLPTRIANALRKGSYETVGDLVIVEKGIVAKVKNLGDKSVEIVQVALQEKGVDFAPEQS